MLQEVSWSIMVKQDQPIGMYPHLRRIHNDDHSIYCLARRVLEYLPEMSTTASG